MILVLLQIPTTTVLVYLVYTTTLYAPKARRLHISLPRSGLREHRQLLQDLGTADEQGLVRFTIILRPTNYNLFFVGYFSSL